MSANDNDDDAEVPSVDETLMVTSGELPPGICIEIITTDTNEPQPSTSTGVVVTAKPSIGQPVFEFPFDNELTLQYLTGKITFLEFSESMDKMAAADKVDVLEETIETDSMETDSVDTSKDEESHSKSRKVKETGDRKKFKEGKVRRRRCDVPKQLECTMGEINLMYARGEYEEAIKECMEVIRQAPQACKPFQTLGMIYENMGDTQKSHQYFLIAAYLDPTDEEEWLRLAELCHEQNDLTQAIRCYTQAIKATTENKSEYIWARSRIYEELKDYKRALEGYQAILPLLPAEDSQKYFNLAWAITRSYHELGEKSRALATITKAFQDHPEHIAAEDVNLLLELQIPAKCYMESIEVLVKHCGVTFTFPGDVVWSSDNPLPDSLSHAKPIRSSVPDLIPIDLRVKLGVCMIHQKFIKIIQPVVEPIFEESIEDNGDLYLDIAEAYMDNGYHKRAEPILSKLVKTESYHLAAVWLRYGECQKCLGDVTGAVRAYSWVVQLAPSHIGARMTLSALQQQLGKHDEALEALKHSDLQIEERKMTKEEQQLLLQKCHLLHTHGKLDEFLENTKQLLFQEWKDVEASEISYLHARTYKHRHEALVQSFLEKGKSIENIKGAHLTDRKLKDNSLPVDELWEVFKLLCNDLVTAKRYDDFEDVSLFGMLCPVFHNDDKVTKDFQFFILTAGLLANNYHRAYNFARPFVLENIDNKQIWNMFIQVIMKTHDQRHNRFCLRRMLHEPTSIPLGIMNAHNSMASGSYKHSLGEYANVFRRTPTDPMISLCIGLNFIHIASQKFSAKRHSLVTQGLAFLNNYIQLRGDCQESYFNVGRALHQINILYAAIHYYKKALEMKPCTGEKNGNYDLSREAAFNLSLIYQASGSVDYARYLLYKYCAV